MIEDRLDIDRIAFIGRTYAEYAKMFDLDGDVLRKGPVLDCAAGPSSFSAEACRAGFSATSCDLMYGAPAEELLKKGKDDIEHVFQKMDDVRDLYLWKYYKNRDEIIGLRHKSLELFIDDYTVNAGERYVRAVLPRLPFSDRQFSLVLAGHFLFLYGDRLSLEFHLQSIAELLRVCAGEIRIFPLQGFDAKPSPHLAGVLRFLGGSSAEARIVEVPFEFQRGSKRMLCIRNRDERRRPDERCQFHGNIRAL